MFNCELTHEQGGWDPAESLACCSSVWSLTSAKTILLISRAKAVIRSSSSCSFRFCQILGGIGLPPSMWATVPVVCARSAPSFEVFMPLSTEDLSSQRRVSTILLAYSKFRMVAIICEVDVLLSDWRKDGFSLLISVQ
jgi:hypothetical protein